jgi:hypothetical protein
MVSPAKTGRMGPTSLRIPAAVAVILVLGLASTGHATWSIVITDVTTQEVALGMATCVNNIDLLAVAGVPVVDRGAGAAQSFVDVEGTRRATIFNGLLNGTPPADILTSLEAFPDHEFRQYGIADTTGGAMSFTGSSNFPFASGVTGSSGSLRYAIQGNLLTGGPVISAIEQAILTTTGDLPARLMAGMEAARATGGDGRCSCPGPDPTACGSPPASFTNSAINGGMVVARRGDSDDPLCDAGGCADGDYFMRLDVAGQTFPNPDPVLQLQTLFDGFRASLEGRPDAIRSRVEFAPVGGGITMMTIVLLDWRGLEVSAPIASLTVEHAPDSDGLSTIGPVVAGGAGTFIVTLTGSAAVGGDRFVVRADDGIRPVILMPNPTLQHVAIDIRPGAEPNPINLNVPGVVPVAILSSATFDAPNAVDRGSLSLAGAAVRLAGRSGHSLCHSGDVNADGLPDLVCQFENDLDAAPGDSAAALGGRIVDGTPIRGVDSIRIVPD